MLHRYIVISSIHFYYVIYTEKYSRLPHVNASIILHKVENKVIEETEIISRSTAEVINCFEILI